ncbi:Mediator of RNA polymerase II transcription subunit 7 [Cichlidogyrus casuarinus]|uniref:Mediator of RNA polymerase II transcription subunit 7 n=1 Tax=Cichlidogyrus casuarinus TaxID=1844966 RepID=A0ABD2QCQ7_9PLAT
MNSNNPEDLGPSHVSLFPMPPWQLVNKYTDAAMAQGTAPPPPPPIEGQPYKMFEGVCNTDNPILRNLECHNIKRVYPQNYNRRRELKRLNFSLLANYLDLLDILTKDPQNAKLKEKLEHIEVLFINMHHLVNEFRPHQARDLLKEILNYQVHVSEETTDKASQYYEKSTEILNGALRNLKQESLQFPLDFSDLDSDLQSMLHNLKDANSWSNFDQHSSVKMDTLAQTEPADSSQSDIDPELWSYLTTEITQ